MKVLLINGSPHKEGCTYTALCEVAAQLEEQGISTEIFWIGNSLTSGCIACGKCFDKSGKCAINTDKVNEAIEKMKECDGLVVGSPVHFAAASGNLTAFLDRMFYAGKMHCAYKPGAAVISARRGGTTAAFDQLNKYFTISNMPLVSSQYWNMVHGSNPDDVKKDLEGMQTMRTLGKNMAWLIKSIDCAKKNGIDRPAAEDVVRTNFIR